MNINNRHERAARQTVFLRLASVNSFNITYVIPRFKKNAVSNLRPFMCLKINCY